MNNSPRVPANTPDPNQEREVSAATVDAAPGDTTDHTPPAEPCLGNTVDYVPVSQGGTGVPGDTDLGETADFAPRVRSETGAPDRKRNHPDIPQNVAGYEILGVLGRGAMGIVYKARQRGLKRLAALKMILAGDRASEEELARFRSEAEAVARLQHPNIVQIFEISEAEGRPFFSLEFVDGSSLDKKIKGTPLPPKEAAALVQKLAEAMHYAHENGIVHRDLKPANVLLTRDGTPKIGDFGLAKQVEEDSGKTVPGTVLGTPSYMAPEQAEGRLEEVGPLADQYSLGAILYELLTGRPPFKGSSVFDTLEQVRTREPVPPIEFQPGVPRDLETICLKCLQKDASRRYTSDRALAEDLRRFLAGEPILARPVGPAERLWRWCKRNPRVATGIATVAVLFVFWALSASALAWGLKLQTDEAHIQTLNAIEKEGEAREQKGIAEQKTKEAEDNADEATKQKGIAQNNEKRAKETAERTIEQMVGLGTNIHSRLDSTLLAPVSASELRQQFLDLLRQSLVLLSRTIEGQGTTKYGTSRVCQALGDLHLAAGQSVEATKMYQQGYEAMKKLAKDEPENDQTQANFAMTIIRLGDVSLQAQGDAPAALKIYTRAREVDDAVLKRPGRTRKEWESKLDVSHTDVRLGWALLALGRPADAWKYLDEAKAYRQYWLEVDGKNWEPSEWIMEACLWLGVAAAHRGDEKAARAQFAEALQRGEDLMKRYPSRAEFKSDVAETQGAFGDALVRFGKSPEAEKLYEASLDNFKVQIQAEPYNLKLQPLLALTHERLGAVSAAQGKRPDAEKHYQEALRLRKALWQIEPTNLVREAAYLLALAHCGQREEAATGATKLQARAAKKTALLLDVARCYAVCAADDTPRKREYAEKALASLKEAVAAPEYKDAVWLRTDPELESIRAAPTFQALVEGVKQR